MLKLERISYGGWTDCVRLANEYCELVIPVAIGPRIIRLSLLDGPNLFCEVPATLGLSGGSDWRLYGGHRFWHAPEQKPRTYYPDNQSVQVDELGDCLRVTQPPESSTQLQKQLDIEMSPDKAHIRVTHRLINHGLFAVTLAPWALSVMTTGSTAIIPLPPRGSHPEDLLPSSTLTLWPYTNPADPRFSWGERHIMLRQDPNAQKPQKIGAFVPDGWVACVVAGSAFVKRFTPQTSASYPDMNSNVEVFSNHFMLELETLGPLSSLEPGDSLEHVEDWFILPDVAPVTSEADLTAFLERYTGSG